MARPKDNKNDRNNIAHPGDVLSMAEPTSNVDEPESGGDTSTVKYDNSNWAPQQSRWQVPKHLRTNKEVPEHRRGLGVVGEALATTTTAGVEEDDAGEVV